MLRWSSRELLLWFYQDIIVVWYERNKLLTMAWRTRYTDVKPKEQMEARRWGGNKRRRLKGLDTRRPSRVSSTVTAGVLSGRRKRPPWVGRLNYIDQYQGCPLTLICFNAVSGIKKWEQFVTWILGLRGVSKSDWIRDWPEKLTGRFGERISGRHRYETRIGGNRTFG